MSWKFTVCLANPNNNRYL